MGHGDVINRNYGEIGNPLEQGLVIKRAIRKAVDRVAGPELALVESYDFAKQRVNVRLKNRPEVLTIFNVPIAGTGGPLKHYQGFKTINEHGEANASIGWLIYFRTDSSVSMHKRGFSPSPTSIMWSGEHPVFVPMEMIPLSDVRNEPTIKDANATGAMTDKLGPSDSALVHSSGSHILFKSNGDVVIKAAGKLYLGDTATAAASMKGAARKDDTVAEGAGDDTISGGSSKVFIG